MIVRVTKEKSNRGTRTRIRYKSHPAVKMSGIKLFKVNEIDWVAAKDMNEAIECLMEQAGLSYEEAYQESEAYELSYEQMVTHRYVDENRSSNNETFQDALNRMILNGDKFPCIFACAEY